MPDDEQYGIIMSAVKSRSAAKNKNPEPFTLN
jgi:hypothetical protein